MRRPSDFSMCLVDENVLININVSAAHCSSVYACVCWGEGSKETGSRQPCVQPAHSSFRDSPPHVH